MDPKAVTLILEGDTITLNNLMDAAAALKLIVEGFTSDIEPDAIVEWVISDITKGSLNIDTACRSDSAAGQRAGLIVHDGWDRFAEDINLRRMDSYPAPVREGVKRLRGLMNGHVKNVLFKRSEAPKNEAIGIDSAPDVEPLASSSVVKQTAFGVLRGRVVGLSQGQALTISIEVSAWRSRVLCYLSHERRGQLGELWDKFVAVKGMITREPGTGRPIAIYQVAEINVLESKLSNIVDAQGCSPQNASHRSIDATGEWWNA